MNTGMSRRAFTKVGAATVLGLTALETSKVLGANQRVRLGFIGVGGRGCQLIQGFAQHPDVELTAFCDVSQSTVEQANQKYAQGKAATCGDFRKILDRQDIDAVVIATPDHWHAIQTILATQSTIHWDPERELITNNQEANSLLHYEYRKPWTLD